LSKTCALRHIQNIRRKRRALTCLSPETRTCRALACLTQQRRALACESGDRLTDPMVSCREMDAAADQRRQMRADVKSCTRTEPRSAVLYTLLVAPYHSVRLPAPVVGGFPGPASRPAVLPSLPLLPVVSYRVRVVLRLLSTLAARAPPPAVRTEPEWGRAAGLSRRRGRPKMPRGAEPCRR